MYFSESAGLARRLVNLCNPEAIKRPNSLPNLVKILSDVHCLLSRDASKGRRDNLPWSQRLSFNIIFFHLEICDAKLIEAPSREKKKASGRDR